LTTRLPHHAFLTGWAVAFITPIFAFAQSAVIRTSYLGTTFAHRSQWFSSTTIHLTRLSIWTVIVLAGVLTLAGRLTLSPWHRALAFTAAPVYARLNDTPIASGTVGRVDTTAVHVDLPVGAHTRIHVAAEDGGHDELQAAVVVTGGRELHWVSQQSAVGVRLATSTRRGWSTLTNRASIFVNFKSIRAVHGADGTAFMSAKTGRAAVFIHLITRWTFIATKHFRTEYN
jgi:hypothetical protein